MAVYVQPPSDYAISGCDCGKGDAQWSEFEEHLWCPYCEKDFIPKDWGLFDGPVPIEACAFMGISFDRFRLSDKKILKFSSTDRSTEWDESFYKK